MFLSLFINPHVKRKHRDVSYASVLKMIYPFPLKPNRLKGAKGTSPYPQGKDLCKANISDFVI
jgi:hypothetical protein